MRWLRGHDPTLHTAQNGGQRWFRRNPELLTSLRHYPNHDGSATGEPRTVGTRAIAPTAEMPKLPLIEGLQTRSRWPALSRLLRSPVQGANLRNRTPQRQTTSRPTT